MQTKIAAIRELLRQMNWGDKDHKQTVSAGGSMTFTVPVVASVVSAPMFISVEAENLRRAKRQARFIARRRGVANPLVLDDTHQSAAEFRRAVAEANRPQMAEVFRNGSPLSRRKAERGANYE